MLRLLKGILAAVGITVLAAGMAVAAPKGDAATCERGMGKAVCCKASVANHCAYVSCCEMGNQGFFTKSSCSACAKHTSEAESAAAHRSACDAAREAGSGYTSCCEAGNRGFYTKAAPCSACEHKAHCAACNAKK